MVDVNKIERLAELKVIIKSLDEEARLIQSELLAEGAPDKVKTLHGILSLTTRTNWECTDKSELFAEVGQDTYLAFSSVPYGATKKVIGDFRMKQLESKELFRVKSQSQYYTLRK